MENLLEFTINAHGGLKTWNRFTTISARLATGGVLWPLKGQQDVLDDVYVVSHTKKEEVSHYPFIYENWKTAFTPGRIAIEGDRGEVIEELSAPRASFAGHGTETPWNRLQLAYFAGYAMWTYFNAPFNFAEPDYKVRELETWEENGETLRRLEVTFPENVATHSTVQIFYISADGLIKRHDYSVDILGGSTAAHYLSDYVEVQGIIIPTKRKVYIRNADDTALFEGPLLVSIDLSEITLK